MEVLQNILVIEDSTFPLRKSDFLYKNEEETNYEQEKQKQENEV